MISLLFGNFLRFFIFMNVLLALKISLVPSLILAVTLAGRRWGAKVAGCLAAFPVVAGPILFFIAMDQGANFAAHAAAAAILAVVGNIAYGIAYAWASRRQSWLTSLMAGWAAYFCIIGLFSLFELSGLQAALLTAASLWLAPRMYPQISPDPALAAKPAPDLIYRMMAGLALVLAVTFFSGKLGPQLSGLLAVFPVMGSVLTVFSHRNVSQAFAVRLLQGMVQGFYAFTMFCLVLASTLASHSITASFFMAFAAAVLIQTALMYGQSRLALKPN